MRIDDFATPTMITWQLTRDCNLTCLHCCTDSAPGKALPNELSRERALSLCDEIIAANVPYVMIVGGEPTLVPHFKEVCRRLSDGGVLLKIESNGMALDVEALQGLAIRSIQISIDGATPTTYAKQRLGGDLGKVVATCKKVKHAGFPLEITFAPTRQNIHEAKEVIDLAVSLEAFRFNTGKLMRLGTAAKLWDRLEPTNEQYQEFRKMLDHYKGPIELCYLPFSVEEEMKNRKLEASGTMLILPDGRVKVTAALPFICADVSRQSLIQAWEDYRNAWKNSLINEAIENLFEKPELASKANQWIDLPVVV